MLRGSVATAARVAVGPTTLPATACATRTYATVKVPDVPYRYIPSTGAWVKVDWAEEKILYDSVVPVEGEEDPYERKRSEVTQAPAGDVAETEAPKEFGMVSGQPEHLRKGRTVTIFQPPKNPNQHYMGYGREKWRVEWNALKSWKNPLMGWDSTFHDAYAKHHIEFNTKEEAVSFAKQEGWVYSVIEPEVPDFEGAKSYADNFTYVPPAQKHWFDAILEPDFSGASTFALTPDSSKRASAARWYTDLVADFLASEKTKRSPTYECYDVPWQRLEGYDERSEWMARKRFASANAQE